MSDSDDFVFVEDKDPPPTAAELDEFMRYMERFLTVGFWWGAGGGENDPRRLHPLPEQFGWCAEIRGNRAWDFVDCYEGVLVAAEGTASNVLAIRAYDEYWVFSTALEAGVTLLAMIARTCERTEKLCPHDPGATYREVHRIVSVDNDALQQLAARLKRERLLLMSRLGTSGDHGSADMVTRADIAAMVGLEENSMTPYAREWPPPDVPHRGRSPAKWNYRKLYPMLKRQFGGCNLREPAK